MLESSVLQGPNSLPCSSESMRTILQILNYIWKVTEKVNEEKDRSWELAESFLSGSTGFSDLTFKGKSASQPISNINPRFER